MTGTETENFVFGALQILLGPPKLLFHGPVPKRLQRGLVVRESDFEDLAVLRSVSRRKKKNHGPTGKERPSLATSHSQKGYCPYWKERWKWKWKKCRSWSCDSNCIRLTHHLVAIAIDVGGRERQQWPMDLAVQDRQLYPV